MNLPFGGELPLKKIEETVVYTDSGRSSLRLFFQSGDYASKKVLVPNFLCGVIEQVMDSLAIEYDYYNINESLGIDYQSILDKKYDILYVINYFGCIVDLSPLDLSEKLILEDSVFLFDFDRRIDCRGWYAFNSYRKIINVPDGSLIKTNLAIDTNIIKKEAPPFSKEKQKAKELKHYYLKGYKGISESEYLEKFSMAELTLDSQKDIYPPSSLCVYQLSQYAYKEHRNVMKSRYLSLSELFKDFHINNFAVDYFYFVIKIKNRDIVRKSLFDEKIYLPVHWPSGKRKNVLVDSVLSIPLSSFYSDKEFWGMVEKLYNRIMQYAAK